MFNLKYITIKKLSFLLATLLIGSLIFTACKKEKESSSEPEPAEMTIVYSIDNVYEGHTLSPGLYFNQSFENQRFSSICGTIS